MSLWDYCAATSWARSTGAIVQPGQQQTQGTRLVVTARGDSFDMMHCKLTWELSGKQKRLSEVVVLFGANNRVARDFTGSSRK